jgi:cytochrome c553
MRLAYRYILLTSLLILPLTITATTGKQLYKDKRCQICHGVSGKEKIQGMPRLWGQKKLYLINQMDNILSGNRDNNYSQLMKMNYAKVKSDKGQDYDKTLTEAEIKELVEFLSRLK